jgi:hypothetical protein
VLLAAAIVTIRIYNYAGVAPAELAAARADTDRIFQDVGISLEWKICRVPNATGGDACTELLRDRGEFVLRLRASADTRISSHAALGDSSGDSLGDSLIDGRTGGGVLITIDPRRVRSIAAQAGLAPAILLGRAIAHEVGHLLIGTPDHSAHGLMRALWKQQELRANNPVDWRFTADQAEAMRLGIADAGLQASGVWHGAEAAGP